METSQVFFWGLPIVFALGLYVYAYSLVCGIPFKEYVKYISFCLFGILFGVIVAFINGYNIKLAVIGLVVTPAMYTIFIINYTLLIALLLSAISDIVYYFIKRLKGNT